MAKINVSRGVILRDPKGGCIKLRIEDNLVGSDLLQVVDKSGQTDSVNW